MSKVARETNPENSEPEMFDVYQSHIDTLLLYTQHLTTYTAHRDTGVLTVQLIAHTRTQTAASPAEFLQQTLYNRGQTMHS